MATQRYKLWEQSDDGSEYRVGSQSGYKTEKEAVAQAEKICRRTGKTIGIGLFEITADGESDCLEVIGFEDPANYA